MQAIVKIDFRVDTGCNVVWVQYYLLKKKSYSFAHRLTVFKKLPVRYMRGLHVFNGGLTQFSAISACLTTLPNMAFDLGKLPAVVLSYLLITPVIWVDLVHPFFCLPWPNAKG